MKTKSTFKTQKQAVEYLAARGWTFVKLSLGEKVFKHEQLSGFSVIQQLRSGKWEIARWGYILD